MSKTLTTSYPITSANGIQIVTSVKCNADNYAALSARQVRFVVMHYTGNKSDTALANARYFQGKGRNASAHYFVDDGHIYQSVGLKDRAWHCGAKSYRHHSCRNQNSIGIEMCCSGNYKVSQQTKANAIALAAELCRYLGITASQVDTYVLRHYDVTGKRCPAQMSGNNNAEWAEFKASIKALLGEDTNVPTTPAKTTRKDVCEVELPVLRKGSKGAYVKTFQILLNAYGKVKITADGVFGSRTEAATKDYQSRHGLAVDGVGGAQTWGKLLI